MSERLYTPRDWCDVLNVKSERTIRRLVSAGKLPAPDVRITAKLVRWRESTVTDFIENGGVK